MEHRVLTSGLVSIAFPAISTGAFGYPLHEAADITLATITESAPQLRSLTHIRLVLFDQTALQDHQRALARLLGECDSVQRAQREQAEYEE